MCEIDYKFRNRVVHHYLHNRSTLKATALEFDVHYNSVYKWVKWYKKEGEERLMCGYKRPWNRTNEDLENRIVLMKEQDPTLTVRRTLQILQTKGIGISLKGVWGIWQRNGYAGYDRSDLSNDYTKHCPWTKESLKKFQKARVLFDVGQVKRSAEILNSVPVLPDNDIVYRIPDSYLNLRRRIERMIKLFGTISLSLYLKQVKALYKECRKKQLNYSALRVGMSELTALSWHLEPATQHSRTRALSKLIKQRGKYYSNLLFAPRLTLLISEGIACGDDSRIKEAREIARYCRMLLRRRKQIPRSFMINLSALYTQFENYKDAAHWLQLALIKTTDENEKRALRSQLAGIYYINGEYKRAINTLKYASLHKWIDRPKELFYHAMWSLMRGLPNKSISYSAKALSLSRKEDLNLGIVKAYVAIANSYCSFGETAKARNILNKLIKFTKKKWRRAEDAFEVLLAPYPKIASIRITSDQSPSTVIALMLKKGWYKRAYRFAEKNGLMAYLHRFVFFAPEPVRRLLDKGQSTGLPKAVLRLPVFNKKVPFYYIKYLGNLIVYKNHKSLRIKLRPKEEALLIHCALRISQPGARVCLDELYSNFWRNRRQPTRNLSSALMNIRHVLQIPLHLLDISWKKENPVLINRGIYFITDYSELEQIFITAQAFKRTGEWSFARGEYLRAFKLFRGEPYRKMYDNWSEQMRRVILDKLETEAIDFAETSLKNGGKKDAKRVLEKVLKIIPDSDLLKDALKTCDNGY